MRAYVQRANDRGCAMNVPVIVAGSLAILRAASMELEASVSS